MNSLHSDLVAFRREVASFLDAAPTDEIREAGRKTTSAFAPFDAVMAWHRILHQRGWSASDWPVEHGGTGWSAEQKYIFAEEYAKRDLPPLLPNALLMVGPLLIDLGTDEQKAKYLPGILSGEDYWAQGYSEPDAGSDLASLRCAAVLDGDDYVIDGSKIWTTLAHRANRMFMLVRTDRTAKKQQGITFLLLDQTDYPGMTIRPFAGLDGSADLCEVHFDQVRIPCANRVGAENDGWSVAKHLLKFERGGAAGGPELTRKLALLREAAGVTPASDGGMVANDPVFHRDLGALEAEVATYCHLERLAISRHRICDDPAYASIRKTFHSELVQRLSAAMVQVTGLEALPQQVRALGVGSGADPLGSEFELVAMPFYLNSRATTIYAGTNEVQRDLISRGLQMGRA